MTLNEHPLLITDPDGLRELHGAPHALLILQIERRRIEAADLSETLETLRLLSEDPVRARAYADRLAVSVAGYDEDPRELYEIPEVRRYFERLTDAWPLWLHFLLKERHTDQVDLLLRLITSSHALARTGTQVAFTAPRAPELAAVVGRLLNAAIDLQERHEHDPILRRTFVARVRAASQFLS